MKKAKSMRALKAISVAALSVAVILVVLTCWLVSGLSNLTVQAREPSGPLRLLEQGSGLAAFASTPAGTSSLVILSLVGLLGLFAGVNWYLLREVRRMNQYRFDMAKLSMVSNKTDNLILILNQDGTIDWANEGFTRITGYCLPDAVGKAPGALLLGARHHGGTIQAIREGLNQRKNVTVEMYCTHSQGHHYWLALSLNPVFNDHEKLVHFVGVGSDITARKRAEEALARASRRNELLLHAMNEGILGVDLCGLITFINPSVTKMTGWKSPDIIGKSVTTLLHQLRVDAMPGNEPNHFLDVAFKDGEVQMGEDDIFRRQDGSQFPVEYTSTPIKEGDQLVGSAVVFRDITERKHGEAFRVRQARHHALRAEIGFALATGDSLKSFLQSCIAGMIKHLDAVEGRIWTYHAESDELVLQANAGCAKALTALERRMPLGTTKVGMIARDRTPQLTNDLVHDPNELNKEWVRKEQLKGFVGLPLVLESRLVAVIALYSRGGFPMEILELLSAVADSIAQGLVRKQGEEKLVQQAALLDKAQDAIMVIDLDHQVQYWNKSAERLYGWTSREILGKRADQLLYRNTAEFERGKDEVLGSGEWKGHFVHSTKSGQTVSIDSQWTLVQDENGQPQSILMVHTDVTEKKQIENKFLRAQRMESIGSLAGGIAHDLNNILSPILMSVEILKERHQDEQSQRLLGMVESSAKRGAGMVQQVLSFSRGIDGERVLLQSRQLIKEVTRIVNETFPKTIKLKTNVADNLWTITGDATQLHQVLVNLTVNARDAMPQGGTLSISAENFILENGHTETDEQAKPGFYVLIKVQDSGTGIPEDIRGKIFDPFFTTKESGKGTGLGLSTVLGIVKSHGGFVKVESRKNQGTQFLVYLPAQESSAVLSEEPESVRLPSGQGETILAVDDEASVLTMTKEMLETYGYRVLTARDGTEAIAAFTEHRSRIKGVLTDMLMPYMDGPATIRTLKKLAPDIRIIAASGLMDGAKVRDATGLDNIAFLMKPFTTEKLLGAVHDMLHEPEPGKEGGNGQAKDKMHGEPKAAAVAVEASAAPSPAQSGSKNDKRSS